ncbi:MAG TPA: ParB/RepB/Spo0J family partition protein [Sulfurovum sp.]|nr:ParB/RepB/Spo0J family partition protein [Sulfurovum sp.]
MGLGRGLGEILSEVEEAYEKDLSNIDSFELEAQGMRVEELFVDSITPNPFQPRKHFDEEALLELSKSISEHGLLQPIVVIEKEDGYLLVAGERRLRAHKLAKLTNIKAIIADVDIDEVRLRELALIENIQRENLNAIELANSYAELLDVHDITHDALSSIVHKSRSQITNTLRLLNLSTYAQEHLIKNQITQGHAKVLIGLDDVKQKVIIDSIIGQKLSVRDTENMIKNAKISNTNKVYPTEENNLFNKYEKDLKENLPFKYVLKTKSIEIKFQNEEEMATFVSLIKSNK